jgi:diphthamide biosynthesis protein 3
MADEDLNLYDEIEIEDCFYDETLQIYHHPCPCGDRFEISIYDMRDGEDIARCPSCSLMIRIIFDQVGGALTPRGPVGREEACANAGQSDLPKEKDDAPGGKAAVTA